MHGNILLLQGVQGEKKENHVKCLYVKAFYKVSALENNAQGQHIRAKVNMSEE